MSEPKIRRGDIYYVSIPYPVGGEMKKDRPAIIVSRDDLNELRPCVTVVYLSCTPKLDLPEHIDIASALRPCKAISEYIDTVDKGRLGKYLGHCSAREMRMVCGGIAASLEIDTETTLQGRRTKYKPGREKVVGKGRKARSFTDTGKGERYGLK